MAFHRLSSDNNTLISAYVGDGEYVFTAPAASFEGGSSPMRGFKLTVSVSKGSAIDSNDYIRIDTSPDDGTTWVGVFAAYDDSAQANFLDGKTGGTSVAFETVLWLMPGQQARLKARAGLTLTKVGISY